MASRKRVNAVLLLLAGCAALPHRGFKDDFSSYRSGECVPDGGKLGRWSVVSTGFGCVKADGDGRERWLAASARPSASRSETHAVLVTGPKISSPFTLSARLSTAAQTRVEAPRDWEAAWLVWDYADRKHFYYFIAKPDGWELGKRDPAFRGGQRFLADGKTPVFPLGTWATLTVSQTGNRLRVYADGRLVTAFTDVQRPYEGGRVGLYGEDCSARFDDVSVVLGE